MTDAAIAKYLDTLATQNEGSAETVGYYLKDLETFATKQLKTTPSELIRNLKAGTATEDPKEEQPYHILQQYAVWLKKTRLDTGDNNERTVRLKISWARTLFEINFIPISRTVFKQQVKSPKPEDPELSPVDKKVITSVLMALDDIRLQSYAMWCASMGWRATESLSPRILNFEGLSLKTLKFETSPEFVNVRGKSAKTKKGKRRQLTAEMARQIEKLLAFNYRKRTIARKVNGKWTKVTITPAPKPEDRVFTPYHSDTAHTKIKNGETTLEHAYTQTSQRFRDTVDRLGIGYEEGGKRRKVTLHTLRRFCYTTCTRAVDEQYAKYHIGRRVHEYDKRTPEQIAEDFAEVEPYLTFFDTSAVEKQQKTMTKRQMELENENEKNSDALIQLADQNAQLMKRVEALEKDRK